MTPRVLVTDGEQRSALAACRALASAGYEVGVAASGAAPAQASRACRERLRTPDPRDGAEPFAARLAELVRGYDVLIAGSDVSLLTVSERRGVLEPLVRLGLPAHEVVERAVDKLALLEAAEAAGLSVPETAVCESVADACAAARRFGFPVVLKAARSFLPEPGGARQRITARVDRESDLRALAPDFGSPFLVQRFAGGRPVFSFSGVAAGGLLAAALTRYVRTWPAAAGPSCFAETVDLPAGLAERVETLLGAVGWEGIFQLQLVEVERGRLAALDLNPRIFGSLALAVGAGANLPAVWCGHLLGRGGPPVVARAGVRYRWEEGELRNALRELGRGQLAAAAAIARPKRSVVHAYFARDDPAPLAAWALDVVRRAAARLAAR